MKSSESNGNNVNGGSINENQRKRIEMYRNNEIIKASNEWLNISVMQCESNRKWLWRK
jgi:hypothetical protein